MKRSTGGGDSRRKSKSSARSTGPKRSYSKGAGAGGSRGGAKPFRSGSKDSERPGERREGSKPERKPYGAKSGAGRDTERPARKPYGEKSFDRPKRDGERPERKSFDRSSDKPAGRSFSSSSRGGDRPDRSRSRDDKPERSGYGRSAGKPTGGGTYLRRRDDRPKREEGDSETRNEERPVRERSETPRSSERTPFREKREYDNSGSFGDKKKRTRIGDKNKPAFKKDDRPSSTGYKSSRSTQKDVSPRSFGENKFEKRPPKEKKRGSFERRPPAGDATDKPWNRKEKHEFYGDRKKKPGGPMIKMSEDGSTRLNKYIANAGICSRREADDMIAAGVITVNGEVITEMGFKVMPTDIVKYNNAQLRSERLVYILLNKPKDFITTTDDPEDRKTVMNLIANACKERVYPVGRLDRNTTGVLIFTNDGDLAKKLTHPSFEVHKIYQVELDRALKSSDMDLLTEGVKLEDGFIKPDDVVYTSAEKNIIGVEIHSGKNRIVRRLFEHLGYEVKKLDRVVFAGLTKKDVPRGRWRFLTEMEVANLKMMTGKRSVKA